MAAAIASAITNDLAPLALEQTTVACAAEEAARVARKLIDKRLGAASATPKGADSAKVAALERALADMRREMTIFDQLVVVFHGLAVADTCVIRKYTDPDAELRVVVEVRFAVPAVEA